MATFLSDYITECRRLLHDANGNFYTDTQLTDYINEARSHTVQDTGCLRTIQTLQFVTGQEVYTYANDFPNGTKTLDVLNVTFTGAIAVLRYAIWLGQTLMPSYVTGRTTVDCRLLFPCMDKEKCTLDPFHKRITRLN